ncbi:MAG TPA: hypothetical protein VN672_00455 [Solirubrobacteraceae bacterium]|nr:hypothetical protein [Solirubrobacteraceae bacterium]
MSTSLTRRGTLLVAAATISLFAALATASQAGAATYYACVKKNGSAHVYAKKPKCKKGESKLSWNSRGPAGKDGVSGKNGANGSNGLNGTNGKEGPPGPLLETLPSGRTEKGVWSFILSGKSGTVAAPISFPIPLAAAPTAHYIVAGTTPPAGCSGSVVAPAAAPGNLCVFETFKAINLVHLDFFDPETFTETPTASGKTGALVVFSATEGTQQGTGTFAVTA